MIAAIRKARAGGVTVRTRALEQRGEEHRVVFALRRQMKRRAIQSVVNVWVELTSNEKPCHLDLWCVCV
jgi:hypothetical protein